MNNSLWAFISIRRLSLSVRQSACLFYFTVTQIWIKFGEIAAFSRPTTVVQWSVPPIFNQNYHGSSPGVKTRPVFCENVIQFSSVAGLEALCSLKLNDPSSLCVCRWGFVVVKQKLKIHHASSWVFGTPHWRIYIQFPVQRIAWSKLKKIWIRCNLKHSSTNLSSKEIYELQMAYFL